MPKLKKRFIQAQHDTAVVLDTTKLIDRLAPGTWVPNLDLCETPEKVVARIELPGVDAADITVTLQGNVLRVSGVKREPSVSHKLLCYYCVERRYGRFDREVRIRCVVDVQKARAWSRNGILTVEFPRMEDRRGSLVRIPVLKQED